MDASDPPDSESESRASEDSDGATCPYCGSGGWFPDEGVCEHLVASWAADRYDNGGGVLGEGMTDNAAFVPAFDLAHACRDLLTLIYEDDAKVLNRRAALDQVATVDGSPWWQELLVVIDDNDFVEDRPEALALFADPIVARLLWDVPGIKVTSALIGGTSMMAGYENFVWSRERELATAQIARAISHATGKVRSATEGLRSPAP